MYFNSKCFGRVSHYHKLMVGVCPVNTLFPLLLFVASGEINELDFHLLQMHFQKSSQLQLTRGRSANS